MNLTENINLMQSQGYCVIPDVIANEEIDHLYKLIVDCGITRIDGMLNIIPELAPLCQHPFITKLLNALLGDDICLANCLAVKNSPPGFGGGDLHIDNDISEISKSVTIPFWHAVQILWAFNDTTVFNGATRVVPFSHHARVDPAKFGYTKTTQCAHEVAIPVKRGTAIVLHALLWHGGGPNTTTDQPRYIVSGYFTLPGLYDQIISCLGEWPAIKPDVFKHFSPVVQNMTTLGLEAGRGGRKSC